MDQDPIAQERRTLKRQATVRSKKGTSWDMVDGQVVILRSVFSVHYPQLLVDVTTAMDESMAASMRPKDPTHVDISFKDLSLAVQVAGQQINVVDQVTGRLKSQTMTALMGGSGAGT
jgi:ABC-type glutathione transport system ATPase component